MLGVILDAVVIQHMHAGHVAVLFRAVLQIQCAGLCGRVLCGGNDDGVEADICRFHGEAERARGGILRDVSLELNAGNGDDGACFHRAGNGHGGGGGVARNGIVHGERNVAFHGAGRCGVIAVGVLRRTRAVGDVEGL